MPSFVQKGSLKFDSEQRPLEFHHKTDKPDHYKQQKN